MKVTAFPDTLHRRHHHLPQESPSCREQRNNDLANYRELLSYCNCAWFVRGCKTLRLPLNATPSLRSVRASDSLRSTCSVPSVLILSTCPDEHEHGLSDPSHSHPGVISTFDPFTSTLSASVLMRCKVLQVAGSITSTRNIRHSGAGGTALISLRILINKPLPLRDRRDCDNNRALVFIAWPNYHSRHAE
jgi:hypothetical protein